MKLMALVAMVFLVVGCGNQGARGKGGGKSGNQSAVFSEHFPSAREFREQFNDGIHPSFQISSQRWASTDGLHVASVRDGAIVIGHSEPGQNVSVWWEGGTAEEFLAVWQHAIKLFAADEVGGNVESLRNVTLDHRYVIRGNYTFGCRENYRCTITVNAE